MKEDAIEQLLAGLPDEQASDRWHARMMAALDAADAIEHARTRLKRLRKQNTNGTYYLPTGRSARARRRTTFRRLLAAHCALVEALRVQAREHGKAVTP